MAGQHARLADFVRPLDVTTDQLRQLERALYTSYRRLAAESDTQFLATPVTDYMLRPPPQGDRDV